MKKNRGIAAFAALACVLSLLAGCGGTGSSAAPSSAGTAAPAAPVPAEASGVEGKKVIVILKSLTNPFFVDLGDGAKAKGQELGLEVEVQAPVTANNNEEQIQLIEQAILQSPDALVIAPADSEGVAPAIEAANEAGIPVINVNTRIKGEGLRVETFVATENYDVAYLTGKALAESMGGKGNLVLITGVPGDQTNIDRTEGAKAALAEYPDITIIDEQFANWKRDEAMKIAQDLMQKHSDIQGFFSMNGEMALGTAEAIAQADKTGQIQLAAIDITEEIAAAIQAGKITMTNDGRADAQGSVSVQAAADLLAGKTIDERITIDSKVVTLDDIDEYVAKYGL